MEKRTALTTAGMVTLVVVAAGVALGANFGILASAEPANDVGDLTPVSQPVPADSSTSAPEVETVYVDEFIDVPAPGGAARSSDSVTDSTTSVTFDDDLGADDEFEDERDDEFEDERDHEEEDEHEEHEGRDEDD